MDFDSEELDIQPVISEFFWQRHQLTSVFLRSDGPLPYLAYWGDWDLLIAYSHYESLLMSRQNRTCPENWIMTW
jgi:hypothetical protein